MNRFSLVFCALGSLCLPPNPAIADTNSALMRLLEVLHENGTIDTDTYSLIEQTARGDAQGDRDAGAGDNAEALSFAEAANATPVDVAVPPAVSETAPLVEVGGRLQVDTAFFDEDLYPHNNGTALRRVSLDLSGSLDENWSYKLQYNFNKTGVEGVSHAWIDYRGFDRFSIRAGHVKEPFSLDNMGSSNNSTFIERALPHDAFSERRNLGVSLTTIGQDWTLAVGAFGDGPDTADGDSDEGHGFSSRFTYTPLLDSDQLLHLGTSRSYRATGGDNTLRFRTRPESHVTNARLADTGLLDAAAFTRSGIEALYLYRSFAVLAEYMSARVKRQDAGLSDLEFDGFYVESSWFPFGGRMNYRRSNGTIGRVHFDHLAAWKGWGALQLAARYSHLDLTDADIDGGVEDNLALGINWYPMVNLRFSANYIRVMKMLGGPRAGDEPTIYTLRGQMAF